jgi:hypothetical protein
MELEAPAIRASGGGRQRLYRRRDIDWNAVERDYRTGAFSLRELAERHRCSHSTIANFAGRHGWIRNPSPAVDGLGTPPSKGEHPCVARRNRD